jgi:hypothetical protein
MQNFLYASPEHMKDHDTAKATLNAAPTKFVPYTNFAAREPIIPSTAEDMSHSISLPARSMTSSLVSVVRDE